MNKIIKITIYRIEMAQSRLEKVGTIYSKIHGFLSTGAIKKEQVN